MLEITLAPAREALAWPGFLELVTAAWLALGTDGPGPAPACARCRRRWTSDFAPAAGLRAHGSDARGRPVLSVLGLLCRACADDRVGQWLTDQLGGGRARLVAAGPATLQ